MQYQKLQSCFFQLCVALEDESNIMIYRKASLKAPKGFIIYQEPEATNDDGDLSFKMRKDYMEEVETERTNQEIKSGKSSIVQCDSCLQIKWKG